MATNGKRIKIKGVFFSHYTSEFVLLLCINSPDEVGQMFIGLVINDLVRLPRYGYYPAPLKKEALHLRSRHKIAS